MRIKRLPWKKLLALSLLLIPAWYAASTIREYRKVYQLTIAIPVVSPFQVGMAAHEQLLVTHVTRQLDGSLCFDMVQDDKPGCIKSAHYYLIEQRLQ